MSRILPARWGGLTLGVMLAGCLTEARVEVGRNAGGGAGTADGAGTPGGSADAAATFDGRADPRPNPDASANPDAARMNLPDALIGQKPDRGEMTPPDAGEMSPPDVQVAPADAAMPAPDAAMPAPDATAIECDVAQVRPCVVECIPEGMQGCVDGRWGVCGGAIDCAAPFCADRNREACPVPVCFGNVGEACSEGCFEGTRQCFEGQWGVCSQERVTCGDAACAEANPDACAPDCVDDDVRPCLVGCFTGRQICAGRQWGACVDQVVRCDEPGCAARFPAACP